MERWWGGGVTEEVREVRSLGQTGHQVDTVSPVQSILTINLNTTIMQCNTSHCIVYNTSTTGPG